MDAEVSNIPDLICIDYPGAVENIDNAIETMGGPHEVSEVLSDSSKKLHISFRPNDKLCKPVIGSRFPSNNFVIKVKVKKKTKEVISWNIIGMVKEEHLFTSLCDFQFLALDKGENVYNKIVPPKLDPNWLKENGPLILPPLSFVRFDPIRNYHLKKVQTSDSTTENSLESSQVVIKLRRKRDSYSIVRNFEDDCLSAPQMPHDRLLNEPGLKKKDYVMLIKKLFEERPICSKSVLISRTGLSGENIKYLTPYVAYYFSNGPWRCLWVRFGYDPKKDPSARIYQTFDFRLQKSDGVETQRRREINEQPDSYILSKDTLPKRSMFLYQYCDIELPEVKSLLAAADVRQECHPHDGWLPEGIAPTCRSIIKQYLKSSSSQKNEAGSTTYFSESDGDDGLDVDYSLSYT